MKKIMYVLGTILVMLGLSFAIAFAVLGTSLFGIENAESVEPEVVTINDSKTKETRNINATSEEGFSDAIHYMSHQKVYAETKWGALEITDERIDSMLETLDNTEFEDEDFYRETLNSWKDGDFSNAVEVHNRIWDAREGNIGEATRLMTKEEEQEYIKENHK